MDRYAGIKEARERLRRREVSAVELVREHLERAEGSQRLLNAFVHIDAEGALRQAAKADEAQRRGESAGPLHGIPVTVKSCVDVEGWTCAAGSLLKRDYVAGADAPLVARLKAAGAIPIGNTNTPEFLMAYETDNRLSGKTSNPWNAEHSAGGSSGGEAAAIAAGCSMGGVGSDGGGSIRVPAHFCGVCGLKPTPGRVPGTGHFPPALGAFNWLGVVGPMARTARDVRILLEAMAGADAGDATSAPVGIREIGRDELRGMRVGILESEALGTASLEAQHATTEAARLLEASGFVLEPLRLNGLEKAIELWWFFFGPMVAHLYKQVVAGREEELSAMLREYLEIAWAEEPPALDALLQACAERDVLRGNLIRQMEKVTVLVSPVSSGAAFRHGEGTWLAGKKECYRDTMRHSQWLNLAGFPGAAVPTRVSKEGLPIGVQIIGRPYEEEKILAVAEALEEARGTLPRPPLG